MANELEKNIETATETEPAIDISALEARIKQLETENGKLKVAQSNASADASEWKKKYQAKLTDEEQTKEKQEEQNAALLKELEDLRTERNVANHKAQFASLGFDDELAGEAAVAMNGGETGKVFDVLRKFITAHDRQLKENAFRSNPTLQGGSTGKAVSKEQFDKMGYTDRLKVYEEHPDLYKEYTT